MGGGVVFFRWLVAVLRHEAGARPDCRAARERGAAEMLRTAQKMAEDIRVLKASVEAMHAAQSSRIAELAGKVEHM